MSRESNPHRRRPGLRLSVGLLSLFAATAAPAGDDLEEIVVTATLRPAPLTAVPASVSVLETDTLRDSAVQHFEDLIGLVPNLNWSAGSSRPRYFQIRGIGELEQYEGAPNPSVGFLIDDMDFSGLGMPATVYDADRIEVIRGPQGTRYGANAIAGLISVRGRDPEETFGARAEVTLGDYDARSIGGVVTGPVQSLASSYRLSVQRYRDDGFRDNVYLHRDDTNDRDELTARLKWRWQPNEALRADLTVLHANLANGYDAFAIDNSRRTLSNDPGEDSERATGAALRLAWQLPAGHEFTLIGSHVESTSVQAYDGDWGNPDSWAPYTYDFIYRVERERRTGSLEARLASAPTALDGAPFAWLVGVYALDLDERLAEHSAGTYLDPAAPEFGFSVDDRLRSRYSATNLATFAQLDGTLAERWHWSTGLRVERRRADYADGAQRYSPVDTMVGGHASLSRDLTAGTSAYVALARGYKAGGFNLSAALPPEASRQFGPEGLWSLEAGLKGRWLEDRLQAETAVFYMRRDQPQVRTSDQVVPGDPNTFVFYTLNAPRARNYGAEASWRWRLLPTVELAGSMGLLRTRLDLPIDNGALLTRRDQPHAPHLQYALSASWQHPQGWFARADVTGQDAFYFDVPPNDTRSQAYALAHLRVGYRQPRWSVSAWVRNAFDRRYATRGFFFGNEPPDFAPHLYVQPGDPRQAGVTFNFDY